MKGKFIISLLVVISVSFSSGPSEGLTVNLDTDVPDYILDNYLNLNGTTRITVGSWTEKASSGFPGTKSNLTVGNGILKLVPSLTVTQLNNGNPVLRLGTGSAWDTMITNVNAIKVNGTYYLYYTATRGTSFSSPWSMGVATSSDGISFTKSSYNPIIKAQVDTYDYIGVYQMMSYYENNTFRMYYGGNGGTTNAKDINVCYATSTDGINYTKRSSNPIILNGNAGTWDSTDLRCCGLVKENNTYRAFLIGDNQVLQYGSPQLGMATSPNGITNWTMDSGNPLYKAAGGGWEGGAAHYTHGEAANGTYRMWSSTKSGPGQDVGYQWSMDGGKTWKVTSSAVISPKANTIYSKSIRWATIIDEGDHYKLYAQCNAYPDVRTYGAFKLTPNKLWGNYTSDLKDFGGPVSIRNITWNGTTVNGTWYKVYVRYGNSTQALSNWHHIKSGTDLAGVSARYVQYKVMFRAHKDWQNGLLFEEFKLDYGLPLEKMEYSIDGSAWTETSWLNDTWSANITVHDGDYDIRIRATDQAGATKILTIPVKVDHYPPTGNITIEEGRALTNSTDVLLDLEADDTHHPIDMQISTDPTFTGTIWNPLDTGIVWSIQGALDGNATVFSRFRDAAGRVSDTYNDSIIIDTTPPTGSVFINDGAKYTGSTDVILSLNWTDLTGVVAIMVSDDPSFDGSIWETPADTIGWRLPDVDGERTVYVKLKDAVGWESVISDSIVLDKTPPSASLSIDEDRPYTNTRDCTLSIALYDVNPVTIKLANEGEPWPDRWQTISSPTQLDWQLADGPDGTRTVRMLVRDAAENEYIATDSIIMDTLPPLARLTLNEGAQFTLAPSVHAVLVATDDTSSITGMRVSNTESFEGVQWQGSKESFSWSLPPGDGVKTVYVQVRDGAGNHVTVDASINLDTTPPSGTISIADGVDATPDPEVTINIDMMDNFGIGEMMASNSPTFEGLEWIPYASTLSWDLGAVEGKKTVFLRVRDLAGNVVTPSDTIHLDLTDPIIDVTIGQGEEVTLEYIIEFTWSTSDDHGLYQYRLSDEPDFEGSDWNARFQEGTLEHVGTGEISFDDDGQYFIYMQVMDLSGRVSTGSASIWYVSARPEGTITLGDGSGWTNTTVVEIVMTWTAGSEPTHFRFALSEDDLAPSEWVAVDATGSLVLPGPGGVKTVYFQLLGSHNVTSLLSSADITLDKEAPTVDIIKPKGGTTESESVTLALVVADDLDSAPEVRWRVNGKDWSTYPDLTKMPLREGDNLIEVVAEDAAGNVATSFVTVTYQPSMLVGGASWIIIAVVLVVVVAVAVFYWNRRDQDMG